MTRLEETAAKFATEAEKTRNTKSTRIWFMVMLIAVIILLYMLGIIKKGFAIGLGIILLAAIGIETLNYDLDLGKLWETGNIEASRVSHTKDGITLMGSCALPTKGEGDLNCANFQTQTQAQAKYDQCANEIASYNDGVDEKKIKSLDIYRLDGDKDGMVCESLPTTSTVNEATLSLEKSGSSAKTSVNPPPSKGAPSRTKNPTKTNQKPSTSSNVYSPTPILNSEKPFPITEATVRTNPKVLPIK